MAPFSEVYGGNARYGPFYRPPLKQNMVYVSVLFAASSNWECADHLLEEVH